MTAHISARIAWHQDGWNGRVCQDPASNVYCVGRHSYPGELIREKRDLAYEKENAGKCCSKLTGEVPPCMYSINAFGDKSFDIHSDPPVFFKGGAKRVSWKLKPSTVCIWPYEEMYGDDVKQSGGRFDYDQRLQNAKDYFAQIENDKSLIVYYANYSNPLNQDDDRKYAIVGISRIKEVSKIRFYEESEQWVKERYGGGFIWQCDVTSHYPDQGFRLPYHLYQDDPEKLQQFAFVPENTRLFKYATRVISDDDLLDIAERFLEITGTLQEMGDKSEDWAARAKWLQSLIGELWESRGLYPGVPAVLDLIGFQQAIPFWKQKAELGKEQEAYEGLFSLLNGDSKSVDGLELTDRDRKKIARQWKLREDVDRELLTKLFPRFALRPDQLNSILSDKREQNGIYSPLKEIEENPYLLCEEYVGDDVDDSISFSRIDHGVFPSPDLGGEPLNEVDDWQRLRALCVEHLKREDKHTFLPARKIIHDINHRLSFYPEWKSHQFTERYLQVDEEDICEAITYRTLNDTLFLYLKHVYESEREIEKQIKQLVERPNITFKSPVTEGHWQSFLMDTDSDLNRKAPKEYCEAIQGQVEVCSRIFPRPLAVLAGGAGTGKTTVIKSLIKAIEKAHGSGTSFKLLAPTGKAADRIRSKTGKDAVTIHSFLAKLGWLNPNMTFKRSGGKKEEQAQTIIVDESSMLDLELMTTLFRAINWSAVQRLILVGDPNQLPPIGRGKCFAEIINYLKRHQPESYAELKINIRQMENRVFDRGAAILELASVYQRAGIEDEDDEETKAAAEELLKRVQEGGDVDKDLRVVYWNDPEKLSEVLIEEMVRDMERDSGESLNPDRPFELWKKACETDGDNGYKKQRAEYNQVISPYRGELFGTEPLNEEIQKHIKGIARGEQLDFNCQLDGIMLFDKVIQITNRSLSNREPVYGYNPETKKAEKVEVFNGELGYVKPHGYDGAKWKWGEFNLRHFQVQFEHKKHWVGYGSKLGKDKDDKWIPESKVENNLELAYAISVHKSQGSEFDHVYFIVPKHKDTLLSPELFYTGITRASKHCTLLIQEDIGPLLNMRRRERSHLVCINSSIFEFAPIPDVMLNVQAWYEEGKIHETLSEFVVRSKSEVIITNMLAEREVLFRYEEPLFALDGTFYLPDFTITWNGEQYFWEHWGRLDQDKYRNHTETKKKWYEKHFPGRLIETFEGTDVTPQANKIIAEHFIV
tara:strand:- start:11957 stop:15601 length:3645 start_codon:yes stop_codon:yes gene_type:complete